MPIRRTTDEQLDHGQAVLSEKLGAAAANQEPPKLVNSDAVAKMLGAMMFPFAGRIWTVTHISFNAGIDLAKLELQVKEYAKYQPSGLLLEEYRAIVKAIAERVWPLVVPVEGWTLRERVLRAIGWKLPNPFLEASEADLGVILTFCLMRRTMPTSPLRGTKSGTSPALAESASS